MTRDQMHNTLRYVREQLAGERGSDFSGVEALDMVIAELEQEPKTDVLDKIRAEIDAQTEIHSDGEFYIKNIDVKRIINKYTKGEQE